MLLAVKEMLTRRDVLTQLRGVGVRKLSQLKSVCREFEQYMAVSYDNEIAKNESPRSSSDESKKSIGWNNFKLMKLSERY